MNIFNNQQTSGYSEIVSYGPKWWTEYREMNAVYRFAGWTLDLMALWLEKLVLNQFPAYADEESIALFEKILHIEPLLGESLEERRKTVSLAFGGGGKLRASDIKSMIRTYSGCDSDVRWENGVLHVRIILDDETEFYPAKIIALINRKLPAHIAVRYGYLVTSFEAEEIISGRFRLNTPFAEYGSFIDGSFPLDGAHLLDADAVSEAAEFAIVRSTGREVL